MLICTIEGCDKKRKHIGRGLCAKHLSRLLRNGDPLIKSKKIRNTICNVDGCSLPINQHGWCTKHFHRWRNHGDPTKTKIAPTGEPLAWLEANTGTTSDECLTWPFGRGSDGYGRVRFRERDQLAHRVMCILVHGEPPTPEHQAAHSCGKGHEACANPRHLRWATRSENEADKKLHGTYMRGLRPRGAKGRFVGNSMESQS